jgi:Putative zinc-finger
MDCEKFESALMDELYGELDELTSAAAKRHVSGCARCAALLGGLRATRRVAAVPRVEPPEGLEQRILAAAAAATPKMVPLRGRLARAVSLAGSWAMRPQTAMAAVFLVMIGTSVLLLRGKSSRAPASAEMTVTEEGTPAPAAQSGVAPAGEPERPAVQPAPPAAVALARPQERLAPAPTTGWAQPLGDSPLDDGRMRSSAKAAKGDDAFGSLAQNGASRGAVGAGGAPPPPPAAAMAPPAAAYRAPGAGFASAPSEAEGSPVAAAPPVDPGDELWAARAARDTAARQGHPCPSGARFDDVASRTPGSQSGWDALYEGALCYESLGDFGSARTRLGTLLGVPSYRDRARATLDRIGREQQGGSAAAHAAPKAAPATAPAAPPADAVH